MLLKERCIDTLVKFPENKIKSRKKEEQAAGKSVFNFPTKLFLLKIFFLSINKFFYGNKNQNLH